MLVLFYYTSPNPLQHELGRTIAGDILKDIELFYCYFCRDTCEITVQSSH
jgi:hypothetical protein